VSRKDLTQSLKLLLDPTLDPAGVTVGGLGLGDPVSEIDRGLAIDADCPRVPYANRLFGSSDGPMIQRQGEAALRPYPLVERVEDALSHGGWVELAASSAVRSQGTIRLDIADRRIANMHLSGPWLEPLGLGSPAAIARALGPNDRYGRSYRRTTWAWPERDLAIAWNDEDRCLASISLGPATCETVPTFDAKSLIQLVLAWKHRHPEDDWPLRPSEGSLAEPVVARRIAALMDAFGFGRDSLSLEGLFSGAFLEGKEADHDRVEALLAYLGEAERGDLRYLPERFAPLPLPEHRHRLMVGHALRHLWTRMLDLRLRIEAIDAFNEGVLAASGIFAYGVGLARHASKQLEPDRDHIDHALSLILDPSQRWLTWGHLVREHGFPDDDLDSLEAEDET
jgi:hypothetical protein